MSAEKNPSWKQDCPADQLVVLLVSIIGWAGNVEQLGTTEADRKRGQKIIKEAEDILRLRQWMKDSW